MLRTTISVVLLLLSPLAIAQETQTLKSAVIALAAQPDLRAEFEAGLVEKALEHSYDAVTTFDIVPDVEDVDGPEFVAQLRAHGVGAVLMIRPAAVGEGASLESVRDSVSPDVYTSLQLFARQLSDSGQQEILSVVHLAIYLIGDEGAELLSAGAVWLDQPNPSREVGIDRLQDLIVANVDAVRPAIRDHLGLAPLE